MSERHAESSYLPRVAKGSKEGGPSGTKGGKEGVACVHSDHAIARCQGSVSCGEEHEGSGERREAESSRVREAGALEDDEEMKGELLGEEGDCTCEMAGDGGRC